LSAQEQIHQVKESYKEAILSMPNVVGVGIGHKVTAREPTDQLCIVVMVRVKLPEEGLSPQAVLPPVIDGVPTDVLEVGDLLALQSRTARWRPAPPGVSIGHYRMSAGTLGCIVHDQVTGVRLILSNNHVLANSNDAQVGDPILQPGAADGGRVDTDTIAHLERFSPIAFATKAPVCPVALGLASMANALARQAGSSHRLAVLQQDAAAVNWVDAAVALPLDDADIEEQILDLGVAEGTATASLGMSVSKSGRTTELSSGHVLLINATTTINYGPGRSARFEEQIVTSNMSRGGDSGSLLVSGDPPRAVGLLFAGSDQVTVHNRIQAVLDALQISLGASVGSGAQLRMALARARAVQRTHESELLSKPNVVRVATGIRQKDGNSTGQVALVVVVREKLPPAQVPAADVLPGQIEGVPVDVQEAGHA
jgi:hypothetical protein